MPLPDWLAAGSDVDVFSFGRWYSGTITGVGRTRATVRYTTGTGTTRDKSFPIYLIAARGRGVGKPIHQHNLKGETDMAAKGKTTKTTKSKTTKAKPEAGDLPRGFDTDKAKRQLAEATKRLRSEYPKLDVDLYLRQVGAGRWLALQKYSA